MEVFTIGFTGRTAESFFSALTSRAVQTLIDVRVNNRGQLAGFTKSQDLRYFLRELGGIRYVHDLRLAPTEDLLRRYRQKEISWDEYECEFTALLRSRSVERDVEQRTFETPTVLLCSEATTSKCHRRLVIDYLAAQWGVDIQRTDL